MSYNPGGGGISSASDIILNNPTTNDNLSYDGAIQKWKNKSQSQVVKAPSAWVTGTSYDVGDYFSRLGVIYRVEVAHVASAVLPSAATARPTDPLSDYSVWAGPGNSPGSLLVRSSSNEVTVEMIYVMDAPVAPTSAANKQYVDDQIAGVTMTSRPAMTFVVIWSSPDWLYQGAVVTARPAGMATGDIILFVGNPGGALPAWAETNDLWTQG